MSVEASYGYQPQEKQGEAPPPYPAGPAGGQPYPGPPPQQGYPMQQPPQQGYPMQQPPQQAGYQPAPAQYAPQATIVVQPGMAPVHAIHFGDLPTTCQCPHCHATVTTATSTKVGLLAWLICLGLFIVGLWLCCFIPFCISSLHDVTHSCPNCKAVISVSKKMGN